MLAILTSSDTSLVTAVPQPATLSLSDSVVSLQSLKGRLMGIQLLEIEPSSVLTPAAQDYCKEWKIDVVRAPAIKRIKDEGFETSNNVAVNSQRLLVAGIPAWMPAIAKQLCAMQTNVCEKAPDDTSVLRRIADGLRAGHRAGVAIVNAPHATCWQAARDDSLRPAVVTSWSELTDVLREVPTNLLILSAKTWNAPSACNAARRFSQHLQNQS